jgi:hypothetical protein
VQRGDELGPRRLDPRIGQVGQAFRIAPHVRQPRT